MHAGNSVKMLPTTDSGELLKDLLQAYADGRNLIIENIETKDEKTVVDVHHPFSGARRSFAIQVEVL